MQMSDAKPVILLVDDDPDILKLVSMRLNASGYEVQAVDSGHTALAALAASRPQLVITDLKMDGMDGMALFEAIHNTAPTLPVIILTAHGTIPEAVAATKRGVFGFLPKPLDNHALLEQVAQALKLSAGIRRHGNGFRGRRLARRHRHRQRGNGRRAQPRPAGGPIRRQRLHLRCQRHRQGTGRARHPSRQRPRRRAVCRGELRRDTRKR